MNVGVSSTMEDSEMGGIVEVKCPIIAQNVKTLNELFKVPSVQKMLDKKKKNVLRKAHHYYYQVQGALHHSKRHFCVFLIWSTNVMHYTVVLRDDEYWKSKMEIKLIRFFNECLVLKIVDSRKERSRPIREAEYCLKAQQSKREQNSQNNYVKNLKYPESKNFKSDKEENDKETDDEENGEFSSENEDNSLEYESTDREEFDENFDEMLEQMDQELDTKKHTPLEIDDTDMEEVFSDNEIEIKHTVKKIKNCEKSESDDVEIIGMEFPETDALRDTYYLFPLEEVKETILSSGKMLTGECMDNMTHVLKNEKFDMISVQHILFRNHIRQFEENKSHNEDIQVISGLEQNKHWRAVHFDGKNLRIYDSLGATKFNDLQPEEKDYINRRYPNLLEKNIVSTYVTIQPDGTSCGVYAFANVVEVWLGRDPRKVRHSQDAEKMRRHFYKILETGIVSAFPTQ